MVICRVGYFQFGSSIGWIFRIRENLQTLQKHRPQIVRQRREQSFLSLECLLDRGQQRALASVRQCDFHGPSVPFVSPPHYELALDHSLKHLAQRTAIKMQTVAELGLGKRSRLKQRQQDAELARRQIGLPGKYFVKLL